MTKQRSERKRALPAQRERGEAMALHEKRQQIGLHERASSSRVKRPLTRLFFLVLLFLGVMLACLLALNLLVSPVPSPLPQRMQEQPLSVLLSKDTGEETVYSLEILGYDDLKNEHAKNWVDNIGAQVGSGTHVSMGGKPVYYTLYNDEFDAPLEMYLFMPQGREVLGDITVSDIRASESGKALVLNIETGSEISWTSDSAGLILHVYVSGEPEKATARTERLIVNGDSYSCPVATFTRLS